MAYTEVEDEGWFSRIADSIKGIAVGILFFMIAPCLLFWNEGRAVKTAKALAEGKGAVVEVKADKVDKGNEGKLVHMTGDVKVDEKLVDPEFKIETKGLALFRDVEMYQWVEKKKTKSKKKVGGGKRKTTTYTYEKKWSSTLHKSDSFKDPKAKKQKRNPGAMRFEKKSFAAKSATLGAFKLTESIISKAKNTKDMTLTDKEFGMVPGSLKKRAKLNNGLLYFGSDPGDPMVGDTRVKFRVAEPGTISLVSQQKGNSFTPFKTSNGQTVELVSSGKKTPKEMFESAEAGNAMMTWILRVVGFFLMFIGLSMVFKPLSVVADVIPFIGSIIGTMSTVVAFLIATPISLFVIAIAWIFYRPLLGILLLLLGGAFVGGIVFLVMKNRKS